MTFRPFPSRVIAWLFPSPTPEWTPPQPRHPELAKLKAAIDGLPTHSRRKPRLYAEARKIKTEILRGETTQ